ncbi:ATP-binding protein [Pseudomonas helleri]|uniref:ATP-binding protein n=1 Tax=Pseudomonas helleri TaxID=1608996 RepID=UPI0033414AC4
MKGLGRLWPKTLFGQLTLILVSGTLAIQLLSSSIWFDVRYAQVLEAPVRLMASRTAPLIDQPGCLPGQPQTAPANYTVTCLAAKPDSQPENDRAARRTALLLKQALAYELGHEPTVEMIEVDLTDAEGQPLIWRSLFGLQTATAHIDFAVPLGDGHWLSIEGHELQGWSGESAWALIADYILRVYVVRIIGVIGMCWLAVRLCLRPLKRLSDAANALGDNLDQKPLAVEGPLEVRQAAQTFNAMQKQIVAMVNDQSFFLAAVSHDLRTPLTRMRLRIERLSDVDQRDRLKQNIYQMDKMITQVLVYLQSANQHTCQFIDVDSVLRNLCAELSTPAEPLPISGRGGMIYANGVLLHRCLQNLLVNAQAYARDITLEVERSSSGVTLRINDRGPGIAPAVLQSITDPFVRADHSRNDQSGGFGLGLSIAKRIAVSHKGSLTLSNREGGGLSACVFLPAQ